MSMSSYSDIDLRPEIESTREANAELAPAKHVKPYRRNARIVKSSR